MFSIGEICDLLSNWFCY